MQLLERVAKPTAQGVTILQQFKLYLQNKNESGKVPSLGCAVKTEAKGKKW